MRFTTMGYNQRYVINPKRRDGAGFDDISLEVSSGSRRIIDTDVAAEAYGWSADQLRQMNEHILSHPDFGTRKIVDRGGEDENGLLRNTHVWVLFLADDQDIPDDYREFCAEQRWFKAWYPDGEPEVVERVIPEGGKRCAEVMRDGNKARPCPELALPDSDYCADHSFAEVS